MLVGVDVEGAEVEEVVRVRPGQACRTVRSDRSQPLTSESVQQTQAERAVARGRVVPERQCQLLEGQHALLGREAWTVSRESRYSYPTSAENAPGGQEEDRVGLAVGVGVGEVHEYLS